MANEWIDGYRQWHEVAVAQGKKVDDALAVCRLDRAVPPSVTTALTEIANELKAHRAVLAAIRQGIETGYPTG
ncbi:MAG: hypothetical protein ACLQGJ_04230 [Candidatus Dormibacteria bacterium]